MCTRVARNLTFLLPLCGFGALPQSLFCHKEAQKAQIGSAAFLGFWCLFAAKIDQTIELD
jgi:hypothetical protein